MSLDPRVQGQREDMIEDIHHHMEQVDVHDDLLNLARTIVSSSFYMTNAEDYGFDSDDFDNYGLVLIHQQLEKIIDSSNLFFVLEKNGGKLVTVTEKEKLK